LAPATSFARRTLAVLRKMQNDIQIIRIIINLFMKRQIVLKIVVLLFFYVSNSVADSTNISQDSSFSNFILKPFDSGIFQDKLYHFDDDFLFNRLSFNFALFFSKKPIGFSVEILNMAILKYNNRDIVSTSWPVSLIGAFFSWAGELNHNWRKDPFSLTCLTIGYTLLSPVLLGNLEFDTILLNKHIMLFTGYNSDFFIWNSNKSIGFYPKVGMEIFYSLYNIEFGYCKRYYYFISDNRNNTSCFFINVGMHKYYPKNDNN
jgi:hypothetical protein